MSKKILIAIAIVTATGFSLSARAQYYGFAGSRLYDSAPRQTAVPIDGCAFDPADTMPGGMGLTAALLRDSAGHPGNSPIGRACSYYKLGTLYAFEGKNEDAVDAYQKAIEWNKAYSDAYEAEGDAYTALGKLDLAAQAYVSAKSGGPDTPDALNGRCWNRAIRNQALDRALVDCTAALADRPGDGYILQSRCFVYYRMGRYDDAIADCAAALKKEPRMADAFYVRGLAESAKGDAAEGNADIAAARNIFDQVGDRYEQYNVKAP